MTKPIKIPTYLDRGRRYVELDAKNIITKSGKSVQEELDGNSSEAFTDEDLLNTPSTRRVIEYVLLTESNHFLRLNGRLDFLGDDVHLRRMYTQYSLGKNIDISDPTTIGFYLKKWCENVFILIGIDLYSYNRNFRIDVKSEAKFLKTFIPSEYDEDGFTLEELEEYVGEKVAFGVYVDFDVNFMPDNSTERSVTSPIHYVSTERVTYLFCFYETKRTDSKITYEIMDVPVNYGNYDIQIKNTKSIHIEPVFPRASTNYDVKLITFEDGIYKDEIYEDAAIVISNNAITDFIKKPSADIEYKGVFKLDYNADVDETKYYYIVLYSPTNTDKEDTTAYLTEKLPSWQKSTFRYPYLNIANLHHGLLSINDGRETGPVLLNYTSAVPKTMVKDSYFTFSPEDVGYCFIITADINEIYIGDLKAKMDAAIAHSKGLPSNPLELVDHLSSLENRIAQLESKISQ